MAPTTTPGGALTDSFERYAALSALAAGLASFLYACSFVILARSAPGRAEDVSSASLLLLGGLLAIPVLVAVYRRLVPVDAGLAQVALLLGLVGAAGAVIHGGYDLANAVNPPAVVNEDLPNQVDPRRLVTLGVAGLAFLVIGQLIGRGASLDRRLGLLSYALGALMAIAYLGVLIVLDTDDPIVKIPGGLAYFVVLPAWYLWVALVLRGAPGGATPSSAS